MQNNEARVERFLELGDKLRSRIRSYKDEFSKYGSTIHTTKSAFSSSDDDSSDPNNEATSRIMDIYTDKRIEQNLSEARRVLDLCRRERLNRAARLENALRNGGELYSDVSRRQYDPTYSCYGSRDPTNERLGCLIEDTRRMSPTSTSRSQRYVTFDNSMPSGSGNYQDSSPSSYRQRSSILKGSDTNGEQYSLRDGLENREGTWSERKIENARRKPSDALKYSYGNEELNDSQLCFSTKTEVRSPYANKIEKCSVETTVHFVENSDGRRTVRRHVENVIDNVNGGEQTFAKTSKPSSCGFGSRATSGSPGYTVESPRSASTSPRNVVGSRNARERSLPIDTSIRFEPKFTSTRRIKALSSSIPDSTVQVRGLRSLRPYNLSEPTSTTLELFPTNVNESRDIDIPSTLTMTQSELESPDPYALIRSMVDPYRDSWPTEPLHIPEAAIAPYTPCTSTFLQTKLLGSGRFGYDVNSCSAILIMRSERISEAVTTLVDDVTGIMSSSVESLGTLAMAKQLEGTVLSVIWSRKSYV